ncbi:hypothetical protein JCM10213v2_006517 [Rhodosporidiobolus nylandii]
MVCARCEAKLKKTSGVAAVDMWGSASDRASQRKVGENKLLSSKARYSPYAPGGSKAGGSSPGAGGKGKAEVVGKCETCKTTVARAGAKFCQGDEGTSWY